MLCHIISYHIISYHIISYHISYHIIIISYHIIYHIVSYIILYRIILYHIMSCYVISYHIISYHVMLYHIIPYHISYHIYYNHVFPKVDIFKSSRWSFTRHATSFHPSASVRALTAQETKQLQGAKNAFDSLEHALLAATIRNIMQFIYLGPVHLLTVYLTTLSVFRNIHCQCSGIFNLAAQDKQWISRKWKLEVVSRNWQTDKLTNS